MVCYKKAVVLNLVVLNNGSSLSYVDIYNVRAKGKLVLRMYEFTRSYIWAKINFTTPSLFVC